MGNYCFYQDNPKDDQYTELQTDNDCQLHHKKSSIEHMKVKHRISNDNLKTIKSVNVRNFLVNKSLTLSSHELFADSSPTRLSSVYEVKRILTVLKPLFFFIDI